MSEARTCPLCGGEMYEDVEDGLLAGKYGVTGCIGCDFSLYGPERATDGEAMEALGEVWARIAGGAR